MAILVLFSAWIPDDGSDDAARWSDFYLELVSQRFADCDKIIMFNPGCSEAFAAACRNLPRVICAERVPANLDVRSDAAGFQRCLMVARPLLMHYDIVLFLHSKGASRGFDAMAGLGREFANSLLKSEIAHELQKRAPHAVHALWCHAPTHASDIRVFVKFLAECAPGHRPFMFNVTYTIYYVSAGLLAEALTLIPDAILTENLGRRFTRFFFELEFPSFLVSIGGHINLASRPRYNDVLNRNLSYNHDPYHCTALVNDLYHRYLNEDDYLPCAIPMIVGPLHEVRDYKIGFHLTTIRRKY